MIFVIDVGNTNMTMGVFQGKKLEATFRIMTKTPRTSDEYGIMITQLLKIFPVFPEQWQKYPV